jgi:hypothetical protein
MTAPNDRPWARIKPHSCARAIAEVAVVLSFTIRATEGRMSQGAVAGSIDSIVRWRPGGLLRTALLARKVTPFSLSPPRCDRTGITSKGGSLSLGAPNALTRRQIRGISLSTGQDNSTNRSRLTFYDNWRKGWDSNPRYPCRHAGFQDRCLKPLGHPSVAVTSTIWQAGDQERLVNRTPTWTQTMFGPQEIQPSASRSVSAIMNYFYSPRSHVGHPTQPS